ncbi:MAG: hypothetical protein LBR07_05885 [Puniceicoccales bacterium]|jgi:hypothetical protein|nr:hypothetical protein [Puniceicoccales bacterium]
MCPNTRNTATAAGARNILAARSGRVRACLAAASALAGVVCVSVAANAAETVPASPVPAVSKTVTPVAPVAAKSAVAATALTAKRQVVERPEFVERELSGNATGNTATAAPTAAGRSPIYALPHRTIDLTRHAVVERVVSGKNADFVIIKGGYAANLRPGMTLTLERPDAAATAAAAAADKTVAGANRTTAAGAAGAASSAAVATVLVADSNTTRTVALILDIHDTKTGIVPGLIAKHKTLSANK